MLGQLFTLASLAGGAFSMAKSAEQNRKIEEALRQKETDLTQWYNKEFGSNYVDSTESKSAIRTLLNQFGKQNAAIDQAGVVSGGTAEKAVAMKGKQMDAFAELMNRLAGLGTQRRDYLKRAFLHEKSALDNLGLQNLMRQDQNFSNLGSNAANLGLSGLYAEGMGAFDDWDKTLSGWFAKPSGVGGGRVKRGKDNPTKFF